MGMDLIAIIEHKKSADEILISMETINSSKDFLTLFQKEYPDSNLRKSNWKGPYFMTKENLEKIWYVEESNRNREDELQGMNYYAKMDIPDAQLTFHRNTISISPHGLHKYGNFQYPKTASFIISINRVIARIFESSKIVYCVDSYEPQSILYDYCLEGKHLEEIINIVMKDLGCLQV